MGQLHYGYGCDPLEIPDRVLAHLRVVATTKLRRQESFPLTFISPEEQAGSGRTTLWMHAAIPLRFEFECAEPAVIERDFLQQLGEEANSANGIVIDGRIEAPIEMKTRKAVAA